jgi:hypothetical protein
MKIAAICAYTLSRNTGMLSVDAALCSFVFRNLPSVTIDFFTIEGEYVLFPEKQQHAEISYNLLTNQKQLYDYDVVIFWGDFLHSRGFHLEHILPRQRIRNPEISSGAFLDRIFDVLLLENAPEELLRKTICFGGSIYFDSPHHQADARYRAAVTRLFSNAQLVLVRDPISAAFASLLGAKGATLGVDCGFLLKPFPLLVWDQNPRIFTKTVGYSFNRMLSQDGKQLDRMLRLVRKLAHVLGLQPMNLRWLETTGGDLSSGLAARIAEINKCCLVVTDTYHCAVNALREGIPTVCVGLGSEHAKHPLSEKKKELLFYMFNAGSLYLYFEEIETMKALNTAVERIVEILQDRALFQIVQHNIRYLSEAAEQQLIRCVAM